MRTPTFLPDEPTMPSNPHEERARITKDGKYVVSVAGGSLPLQEIRERIREGDLLDVRQGHGLDSASKRVWVIDRRTGECIYSETRWNAEPWVTDIVGAAEELPQAGPIIVDRTLAQARFAEADQQRQLQEEEEDRAIEARLKMQVVE